MKQTLQYVSPVSEIIHFEAVNVLTMSGVGGRGSWDGSYDNGSFDKGSHDKGHKG